MTDEHVGDRVERRLDDVFAAIRCEEPAAPLRRDLVWQNVARARQARRGIPATATHTRRWAIAAAAVFVASGALAVGRLWDGGAAPGVISHDPLLVDAASVLRTVPGVSPGSAAADSLGRQSAFLLAATRSAADQAPEASARQVLLHDMEYVLAQLVEGGLEDPVERELTLNAIRTRKIVERVEEGAE